MPTNPVKRRCAQEGCRAWAQRGYLYCHAHLRQRAAPAPTPSPPEPGTAPGDASAEADADVLDELCRRVVTAYLSALRQVECGVAEGAMDPFAALDWAARMSWAIVRLLKARQDVGQGRGAPTWLEAALALLDDEQAADADNPTASS